MNTITLNLKARRFKTSKDLLKRQVSITTGFELDAWGNKRLINRKTTREGIAIARALIANFKKNKITPNIRRKSFSQVQIAWGIGVWTK